MFVTTVLIKMFDQEFGVHCILVSLSTHSWVVPARGATRATVSTGRPNYFSNPVALQGIRFYAKARPTA